jgi:hypothetical protein
MKPLMFLSTLLAASPGLFVETVEEATKLTESDPAVQRGTLQFELRPWYGSAASMEVSDIHKTIEKKSVADLPAGISGLFSYSCNFTLIPSFGDSCRRQVCQATS